MPHERKLLVLPGYSDKNKHWLEEAKENLSSNFIPVLVYWPHWSGKPTNGNCIQEEVVKLAGLLKNDPIDVIAKSIGTLVAAILLEQKPHFFKNIILCGLPLNDLTDNDKLHYKILSNIAP